MRARAVRAAVVLGLAAALAHGRVAAAEPVPAGAGDLPAHDASDPSAPLVDAANLLASERFWPYQVVLVRPWRPPGREAPLPAGARGVLIRVEAGGHARVDFGRDGLYAVPVAETDLLARANRIRRGEEEKTAPNLVLAIGPRLVDPESEPLRALPFTFAGAQRGFLAVFADPGADGFEDLAHALAPLRDRHGVATILFPQGPHPDAAVRDRLRALGWPVAFVFDHLAEPYTRTLLGDGVAPPAVSLQSREGRVLHASTWSADAAPALAAALDAAFADPGPALSATSPR